MPPEIRYHLPARFSSLCQDALFHIDTDLFCGCIKDRQQPVRPEQGPRRPYVRSDTRAPEEPEFVRKSASI